MQSHEARTKLDLSSGDCRAPSRPCSDTRLPSCFQASKGDTSQEPHSPCLPRSLRLSLEWPVSLVPFVLSQELGTHISSPLTFCRGAGVFPCYRWGVRCRETTFIRSKSLDSLSLRAKHFWACFLGCNKGNYTYPQNNTGKTMCCNKYVVHRIHFQNANSFLRSFSLGRITSWSKGGRIHCGHFVCM